MIDGNPTVGIPRDPHSKKMFQLAEVLHLEFPSQLRLYTRNISSVLAGDEQIVDPNRDADVSFCLDVKGRVCIGSNEANFDQKTVDLLVPNRRRLFKAVKGSQYLTHEVPFHPGSDKSFRLHHIDFFIQYSKQVGRDHIHSVYLPLSQRGKREDDAVRGELGDGRICFEVIDPVGLRESSCNQSGLESDDIPIYVVLGFENHFQVTRFLPGGSPTSSHAPFFIRDSYSS